MDVVVGLTSLGKAMTSDYSDVAVHDKFYDSSGKEYNLHRYILKDGNVIEEYVQLTRFSNVINGNYIFLGLRDNRDNNVPLLFTLWNDEQMQNWR